MASAPTVPPRLLYELPFFGDRVVPARHANWGSLNFWQPPILSAPIVNVPGLDDVKPITLTSLTVDAKISGFLAKTTVYMSFYNPHDRTLEGELQFPLPDGATVSGYGLDVNEEGETKLVDATIVEKKKARQVFEAEVRKGIDPGLVEHSKGNMFNTRVYPLPPHDFRYIKLEYVSELVAHTDGKLYYYHPLNVKNEIEFRLNVEVICSGTEEAPVFTTEELSGISFNREEFGAGSFAYKISVSEKGWNFLPTSSALAVCVARPENKTPVVYVEESNQPDEMEQFYFVVQDYVPAMKLKEGQGLAKRIAVFWDASLSRATVDKTRELQILKQIVDQKVQKKGHVDLYIFRNVLESRVEFDDSSKLITHLTELPYDGATRLDSLNVDNSAGSKDISFVLLFTDGLASVGGDSCALVEKPVAPVHVVTGTGKNTNHTLLKYFANSTGGLFFDVSRYSNDHILSSVGLPTFTFVSASGDKLEHVLPATITPVAITADHGQHFTISGRLTKPGKSELTVQYGYSKNDILHTSTHIIDSSRATGTGLVGLAWAQQALAALSALADKYDEEIRDLGQRFKIVTPNTSLLVLESLAQHIEHKIEPAQTRKAMWEQYHAHMESQNQEKVKSEENKLSRVTGMWQTRVSWWERDFQYDPTPVVAPSKKMAEHDGASLSLLNRSEMLDEMSAPAPTMSRMRMAAPQSAMRRTSAAAPPPPAPIVAMERHLADEDDEEECKESAFEGDSDDIGGADAFAGLSAPSGSASAGIRGVGVKVQAWDPATPYIKTLADLADRTLPTLYKVYLAQRDSGSNNYSNSPAFYFDCAHYFLNQSSLGEVESRTLGVRILTNIPELKLEEPQLLRMLGYKLDEMNELDLAIEVFEKVLKLRPDEPQSHRDLALVLEKRARSGDYQRAINLLWAVVVGPNWRSDFDEVEITALVEMNALIAKAERQKVDIKRPERSGPFIKNLECDLRISMGWDTDNTDFDLHVVEPNGEECYFGHRDTRAGGMMSRDFRGGYGPEEYMLKKAFPGEFRAWTNYFAMHSATLTGPSSIILKIFVNWGRESQQEYVTLTRLQESKNNAQLGSITIPENLAALASPKPGPGVKPVSNDGAAKKASVPSLAVPAPAGQAPSSSKSPRASPREGNKSSAQYPHSLRVSIFVNMSADELFQQKRDSSNAFRDRCWQLLPELLPGAIAVSIIDIYPMIILQKNGLQGSADLGGKRIHLTAHRTQ
eukprot:TRINITY_DN225_c0_g3_i1.p1 TRINITY_DN225_c0_g3~~TRINITY_DN225_c0_g3_i1.p1  ORF type:complete len:1227 (+),score=276.64 TRINITY_DN225_c0_g3_i1:54-3734(+)